MKIPHYNYHLRLMIRAGTLQGDWLLFRLAWLKLIRAFKNLKLLNRNGYEKGTPE